MFNRVWSCFKKFEGHQTFDQKLKLFLLFSCLMGDVLFVWTAAYQTCLMRACVPGLLNGNCVNLVPRAFSSTIFKMADRRGEGPGDEVAIVFDQTCFNRLANHFNISMFGHQTMFDGVWSPNISRLSRPLEVWIIIIVLLKDAFSPNGDITERSCSKYIINHINKGIKYILKLKQCRNK